MSAQPDRLQALRRYDLLDTPPEAPFDELTALVARLLHTRYAALSLVDHDRQWFKSCYGLPFHETGLAFCAVAVEGRDVLVIPDALQDARFEAHALVTGAPHVRFYAGAPLITPEGFALGTLCVLDPQPRAGLTPDERHTLRVLADSAMSALELRRMRIQAAQGARLYASLLNAAPDAVIRINSLGQVLEWNARAEALFGYRRDEMLGHSLEAIMPERFREAHRQGLARLAQGGQGALLGRHMEVCARRRDGSDFTCAMIITPLLEGDHQTYTAFLSDVSDHKRAEQALVTSNNMLHAVLAAVPEAIFVKDLERRYTMVNPPAAELLGREVGDLIGRTAAEVGLPEAAATGAGDEQVLQTGRPLAFELTAGAPGGTPRTYLARTGLYRDAQGNPAGLVHSATDITDRQQTEALLAAQNQALERRVGERTQELEDTQLEMLERLARAAERRDDETGQHVLRVAFTAARLARALGLSDETAELIRCTAPLHDLGKIGIPDAILLKPARLTAEEMVVVRQHTTIGASILAGGRSALMQTAHDIALTHHERWDGLGYPNGLAGEAIPIAGRIVAVADVLDALTSDRPYKRAWSFAEALAEISRQAGRQFDPQVVAALKQLNR